jgi:hypothetical protein
VHVAMVGTQDNVTRIYVNGTEVSSYDLQNTPTGIIKDSTGFNFYVGRNPFQEQWSHPTWKGKIGGFIRVWERSLSGAEIDANKNLNLTAAKESNLLINVKFTEGAGTTVSNEATSTHNASLTGSPSWVAGPTITEKTTYTIGTAYGQTLTVSNNLTVGDGTNLTTVNASSTNPIIDVNGNTTIATSSIFSAATSSAFTVAGNYTNNGTFTANSGTTTFDGTSAQTLSGNMIGANAFYTLSIANTAGTSPTVTFSNAASSTNLFVTTPSVELNFLASAGYTFTNFTLNGQDTATRVKLRSSITDTPWKLYVSGTQSVLNTDAKDSDASGGAEIDATNSSNYNSNGNTNWNFGGAYLSFSISDNSIGFAPLSSGGARFATGDGSLSTVDVEAHTLTASTTASDGYTITVRGTTLASGSNTITAIGGTAATSTPGSEQFGLRAIATGGSGIVSAPYNDVTDFAYNATAETTDIIATTAGISGDTIYSIHYMANINSLTEAGSYSTNLTYVITANF